MVLPRTRLVMSLYVVAYNVIMRLRDCLLRATVAVETFEESSTMTTVSVTIRLDPSTVEFLDKLAVVEERDRSYMVRKAVTSFVELRRWQIEEIEKAVKEADSDLFLSDTDSASFMDELAQ